MAFCITRTNKKEWEEKQRKIAKWEQQMNCKKTGSNVKGENIASACVESVCLWVGGSLGVFGGCEKGIFTLCALPTWRMLRARGQMLTFCTDHIRHYYHHCFSCNRAQHQTPMRPEPEKMGERTAIYLHWGKGWRGQEGRLTVRCIQIK